MRASYELSNSSLGVVVREAVNGSRPALRTAAAWFVLGVALVATLFLLNGASFSAWMSGDPSNPYQHGWVVRSWGQLSWAVAAATGGCAAFRGLREFPSMRGLTVVLAVICVALALLPSANQVLQIDRCLDSGGRWNYDGLQCER